MISSLLLSSWRACIFRPSCAIIAASDGQPVTDAGLAWLRSKPTTCLRCKALVVDAGINTAMAHQIQQTVRRLTDRPILWLVNTVYHGDHTFGNAAFPAATKVIASRQTAAAMTDLEAEKRARAQTLHGNLEALADVTGWRRPDVVFDGRTQVDLGGRTVQLWHFGPGNGPGDTVVWVPEARAAWTGNLLGHRRVAPMLLEGGPAQYIDTLARFKSTLNVKTIVPGHGPLADGHSPDAWLAYLQELLEGVIRARRLGLSALATVETVPLPRGHGFPARHPAARMTGWSTICTGSTSWPLTGTLSVTPPRFEHGSNLPALRVGTHTRCDAPDEGVYRKTSKQNADARMSSCCARPPRLPV